MPAQESVYMATDGYMYEEKDVYSWPRIHANAWYIEF